MLEEAGHRVLGIDISDTMVALSRAAVPSGVFAVGDMRTWVPKAEQQSDGFDAVFNILSLFILNREEIEEMAGKWSSWLKRGGLLCICTMAAEDLRPKKEGGSGYDEDGLCARDIGVRFMGNQVKITLFSREGWKWLLESKGFEVLSDKTEVHTPPPEADSDIEPHYYLIARKK